MLDAPLLGTLTILGFAGAFFSGLLGIGGAIIMIPSLFYVPPALGLGQLDMRVVSGITIVQVFFASLSGVLAHRRSRMVNPDLVAYMGGGIVAGSLAGAIASRYLRVEVLTVVFAGMALLATVLMFVPRREQDWESSHERLTFNRLLAVAIALAVGFLAGMVGAGGAFLLIPLMLYFLKIPTRVAVGSSLGIVFLSSIGGLVGKLGTGQVAFPLAAALILGAIPGAQVGGMVSKRLRTQVLRLILALVIAGTAIKMWSDVLAGR